MLQPGEYSYFPAPQGEPGNSWWPGKPYWYGKTPNGHEACLLNHEITIHEDGTITVSPSILVSTSYDGGKTMVNLWHGYLEHGVWREC